MRPLRIFAITTEQSAEAILKDLLTPIREFYPDSYIEGVASKEFSFDRFIPFMNSEELKIMGLIDVLLSLYRIVKIQSKIKKRILEGDFDLVLTVDSSSFHIPLVQSLKKSGCKARFVHAVCPPIWAYRPGRKPKIATTFDLLLPLFAFEQPLFQDTPLESFWIGHPFKNHEPLTKNLDAEQVLCLFPGSRKRVIERNLPLQLAAAKKFPYKIHISVSSPHLRPLIEKLAPNLPLFEKIPEKELLSKTVAALATSGTITLELALLGIPTVVTYKLPLIDAIAAKLAKMNVTHFALPNLLAKTTIFPEFIHPFTTPAAVAKALQEILATPPTIPFDKLYAQIRPTHTSATLVTKILQKINL